MSSSPYTPQWRVVCNDLDCGWSIETYEKGRAITAGQVHEELKPGHTVSDVFRIEARR